VNTAARVAKEKRTHPERFCDVPACLWRIKAADGTSLGPCRTHEPERFEAYWQDNKPEFGDKK
jgi:hypothetical protein